MRTITNCRSCNKPGLMEIANFGEQYLSDFRPDKERPPKYPLVLMLCTGCKLVQLKHTVPSYEMYHDRYGFKSGVNDTLKADLKEVVEQTLQLKPSTEAWLDIASNDGTLLSYVPNDVYRVGVDPITPLCKEAEQHADYIINDFFDAERMGTNDFDVVTSISMFYDLDDPNTFVAGVEHVMGEKAIWVIQQNYLLSTLEIGGYDNVCHEHLEYYSLISLKQLLERHGLEIFKCSTSPINGGSIRTFVARKGDYEVDESVRNQLNTEYNKGLGGVNVYTQFGRTAAVKIRELRELVYHLADQGKTIFIMGASTRGATIWQAAKIGPEQVEAAVERNPAKVGKRFSAIDVPIISEEDARHYKPDIILIGPWFVAIEILEREKELLDSGTRAIIPLPTLRIV